MKCQTATPATPAEMAEEKTSRGQEGGRKSSKPLMEKKRRARINDCLTELQRILDALNSEGNSSRQNKREKADILEQTVKLVKQLRQQGGRGNPPDPQSQVQFRAGFNECMATVAQFLSTNQNAFNGDAKAGLMTHLANSLQCNKPYADRLPHTRRRTDEPTNSVSSSIRPPTVQPTSSQSEHGTSSLNVVHPMPPASAVLSPPSHSSVAVATGSNSSPQQAAAIPGVTARLELTPHAANGGQATRLVPISIPIKVQSPGQFILLPSQMFSGGQLAAPVIPVLSSPPSSVAPGPSSTGSSGSVAMSPVLDQRPPPKSSPQPQLAAQPAAGPSAMVYAPYPAAALGIPAGAVNSPQAAARYPVAFVAISEPREGANGAQVEHNLVYPNLPGFYAMQANPPNDPENVWRPW